MTSDEQTTKLTHQNNTSVAVPSRDVLLAVDVQPNRLDRPAKVGFSVLFIGLAVLFLTNAARVDTDPDALMPSLFPFLLVAGTLAAAAAAVGVRSVFVAPSVEVTPTLLRVPVPFRLTSAILVRSELTEANLTTLQGRRTLVLATPSRTVLLRQREFLADDWERLIDLLNPTGR